MKIYKILIAFILFIILISSISCSHHAISSPPTSITPSHTPTIGELFQYGEQSTPQYLNYLGNNYFFTTELVAVEKVPDNLIPQGNAINLPSTPVEPNSSIYYEGSEFPVSIIKGTNINDAIAIGYLIRIPEDTLNFNLYYYWVKYVRITSPTP